MMASGWHYRLVVCKSLSEHALGQRDTFDDFTPNVQFARAAFADDLRERWVDKLSPDIIMRLFVTS